MTFLKHANSKISRVFKIRQKRLEVILARYNVSIEKDYQLPCRFFSAQINGRGKTGIFIFFNNFYLGIFLSKKSNTVIIRGIIDDDDLGTWRIFNNKREVLF